ncbi:hypothetical protein [Salinispora arenicola]|uniref:hypothetical protein n=1 Tax=Salinispora arenicola TaxID=168697 RepID=UPI000374C82A|nr:hypothetical protein [Salinispora arenicola]
MLVDCDGCVGRANGCSGCLVTALLDEHAGFGAAEARAIEVFARAGFDVQVLPEPRHQVRRPDRRRRVA